MPVGEAGERFAETAQQLAAIGRAGAERVHAFVVPARQHVLRAVGHGEDMDANVVLLADAIQAADALFKQIRVERQIPQDQPVRELEVAAFRTDFRTQQQACAIGLGEVRRVAIALHDAEALMEARHANAAARTQGFFQGEHLGLAAADQQEFVLRVFVEQVDQCIQTRVIGVVDLEGRRWLLDVRVEFGEQGLSAVFAERFGIEQVPYRQALGKTADARAAIAEHGPTGAVAIDQRREDLAHVLRLGRVGQAVEQGFVAGKGLLQDGALRVVQCLVLEQPVGDL
jgi:hypothetical protein